MIALEVRHGRTVYVIVGKPRHVHRIANRRSLLRERSYEISSHRNS